MMPEPQTPRWGRGEEKAKHQGAIAPTSSGGTGRGDETRRGPATLPHALKNKQNKKAPGVGEGYRVFRIRTSSALKVVLAALYRAIFEAMTSNATNNLHKDYLYYKEEFLNMLFAPKPTSRRKKRRKGRRRKKKKKRTPPIPLLAQFRWKGRKYGSDHAVCIFNLDNGVLVLKGTGVTLPLDRNLVETLIEELELSPPPKFTVFLTCRGRLRLVAHRSPPPWWWVALEDCDDNDYPRPFVVFAVDVNSRNGLTVLGFEIGDGIRMIRKPVRVRPPRKEWGLISLLQSYKDRVENARKGRPSEVHKAYEELRKVFPARVPLTPSIAKKLCRVSHQAQSARRKEWGRKVISYFRRKIREHKNVIIVVDKPDPESLRGTPLQGTLLRICERLKNLCNYEGALYMEKRASGQYCPLCGRRGVEVKRRYYCCKECNVVWNRDYGASFNLVARFLENLGLADELRDWLRTHPRVLAPNFEPRN